VQVHKSNIIIPDLDYSSSPACRVSDPRPTHKSTHQFLPDLVDIDQIDPRTLGLMPTRTDRPSFLSQCDYAYADRKRAAQPASLCLHALVTIDHTDSNLHRCEMRSSLSYRHA
jgi:hypothetical protein